MLWLISVARKNPHAVALGRRGGRARAKSLSAEARAAIARKAGKRGGLGRAAKLTPEQRREIARKAGKAGAAARWRNRTANVLTPKDQ